MFFCTTIHIESGTFSFLERKLIFSSSNIARVESIPHICHFYSTYPIFGSIFLHAKARKSRQNGFRKNSVIRHKTDFTTTKQGKFLISSHMSCGDMWNSSKFGKNSHFSASIVWKKLKFLCMWRNLKFLHICHVLKSEIFSTWLIFLHLYIGDRGDKYEVWALTIYKSLSNQWTWSHFSVVTDTFALDCFVNGRDRRQQ